jgi:hypothetical protein
MITGQLLLCIKAVPYAGMEFSSKKRYIVKRILL